MSNDKKQPQVKFQMIPMAQFPRVTIRRPVEPKPSKMYQGKAKNGTISPRKAQ